MKIFIASMKMRGPRAKPPAGPCHIINVTSAQATHNLYRQSFSPMTPIPNGYKGYYCFENYWQAGKVWEGVDNAKVRDWWRKQTKGKRRCPMTRGKKVLYSEFNGVKYDYIQSRKKIYVPEYFDLMKHSEGMKQIMQMARVGGFNETSAVVYDFDGPKRTLTGDLETRPVTHRLLCDKINDPEFPFGHGYVVAAWIAGFSPANYCQD